MSKENLEELIKESFPDALITIEDLKGDGDHYSATVISKSFQGKSKIDQHKIVYKAFDTLSEASLSSFSGFHSLIPSLGQNDLLAAIAIQKNDRFALPACFRLRI